VIEAFLWGGIAASSLLLGSILALKMTIPPRTLGLIMGFGAGVLLSAVAYDLVLEAIATATGNVVVFLGLLIGAFTFFLGNRYLERQSSGNVAAAGQPPGGGGGGGMALILGAVLDGIPESIVLGLTLIGGGEVGITVLIAILLSNLPEGIAGTNDLVASGWTGSRVIRIWVIVVIASAFASFAGYAVFGRASPNTVAFVQAFAGGAVIAMLTDTMIPEAYERGGSLVGLITAVGFAMAFGLILLEWIAGP
jgi:ZIP family zinc transporter